MTELSEASTAPRAFVFVLMPFADAFDDVYHLGIREACESAGAYAERLDDQIFEEAMLARVYNQIAKADILVADMTGRNANVFYEVGYAHALGKRTILLTQTPEDIPFDLKHFYHIVYGGSVTSLRTELAKRVRWMLDNPADSAVHEAHQIQVFSRGQELVDGATLQMELVSNWSHRFQLDLHNSTAAAISVVGFQLALITSERVARVVTVSDNEEAEATRRVSSPTGENFFMLPERFELLPESWESVVLSLQTQRGTNLEPGKRMDMGLRILTVDGPREVRFMAETSR